MRNNELKYEFDAISTVLSRISSKDAIFNFLSDLMTEKEMVEFSRRFEVAKMLDKDMSYSLIEKKTGMSSTTIAKISKALKSKNWWYKTAINIFNVGSVRDYRGRDTI